MTIHHFKTNIHCGNCIAKITPFLEGVVEIESWSIDLNDPDRILQVTLRQDQSSKVIDAIRQAGFEIELQS